MVTIILDISIYRAKKLFEPVIIEIVGRLNIESRISLSRKLRISGIIRDSYVICDPVGELGFDPCRWKKNLKFECLQEVRG